MRLDLQDRKTLRELIKKRGLFSVILELEDYCYEQQQENNKTMNVVLMKLQSIINNLRELEDNK